MPLLTNMARRSLVFVALLLSGCAGPALSTAQNCPTPSFSPYKSRLGVLRENWHTGLVLPASALTGPLAQIWRSLPHTPFVAIGWGNRRYYMARHPSLLTGLRALFPSPSVLYVTAWSRHHLAATAPQTQLYWQALQPRDWRRLRHFLVASFAQRPNGSFEELGPKTPHSRFFASTLTYDAWHTCNTWTADALHAAGLPLEGGDILFAGQVTGLLQSRPRAHSRRTRPICHPPHPLAEPTGDPP